MMFGTHAPLLGRQARADNDAPEVAHQPYNAPIPAIAEHEGLQSANYEPEKSEPHYTQHDTQPDAQDISPPYQAAAAPQRKRAAWPWIIGAVAAGLIGLGAGIGIGYAVGEKNR